jgi:hypothetical protein
MAKIGPHTHKRLAGVSYLRTKPLRGSFNEGGRWFNFHTSRPGDRRFLYLYLFGRRFHNGRNVV